MTVDSSPRQFTEVIIDVADAAPAERPAYEADVLDGTDIHDVCRAVIELLGPRRLPKKLRAQYLDADGDLVCRIAERVLKNRYGAR